ncbi:MAG: hypothetical protein CO141_02565 [Candidatus Moranbacteria bacterium CG_4_9_14_3_um_filter_42_9]|nr:MAG: hypothetical protein CO141_02565 [Candidatus Moranbacteria bacterium CG_4_9_14_3_um_filter_42_9]
MIRYRERQKRRWIFCPAEWLGKNGWYLAGGTALALQVGQRRSVDLDFFMNRKNFDNIEVLGNFS